MSKYQFLASDIYLPGTDIPRNLLGIEDGNLLHEVEETLLQQAYRIFISELQPTVRFDENYFKSLHQRTFAALYDWAGAYRTVDMRKADSLFCRADYLTKESERIFRKLEQEAFLKTATEWTKEKLSERLTYYQCELIALHPFYELNGRITRLFFDLIAVYNGYEPIDYSQALFEETTPLNAYIRASMACVQQADQQMLYKIILEGLNKSQ